jgi:hypothetical protein
MPRAATAFRLVERAAKCDATAFSARAATIQARATAAFTEVSRVEKVFEATRTRVRAGSRWRVVSRKA